MSTQGSESGLLTAVIVAVSGILSAVIIACKDTLADLLARRQRNWSGLWTGTGYSRPTKTTYQITASIRQRGRRLTGKLTTHLPEVLEYTVKGRIEDQEFMTYRAVNTAKNSNNYLVGVNCLSRDGKHMTGAYVARSRLVDRIADGTIDLEPADR